MGDDEDSSRYYSKEDFKRQLDKDPKALLASLEGPKKKKKKPEGDKERYSGEGRFAGEGGAKEPKEKGKGKSKGKGKGKEKGDGEKGDGEKGKGKGKKGKGKDAGDNGKGGHAPAGPKEAVYRDRAQERREMKGEYETVAAEFENHGEVSLDDSKYLGGDMDHTHLVKGLDYALLRKVRTEMTKHDKHEQLKDDRAKRKAGQKEREFATTLGKKIWHTLVDTLHPHHSTFRQRLQRMGRAIAQGQRIRGAPSTFLEGRMAYEFDLGAEQGVSDIPRTVYMSKEEAPKVDHMKRPAHVLQETVEKVKGALKKVAEERKQRKLDKAGGGPSKPVAAFAVAAKVVNKHRAKDINDDIFGGAGKYDPTEFARKEAEKKRKLEERRR